jgi:hypothetical protein
MSEDIPTIILWTMRLVLMCGTIVQLQEKGSKVRKRKNRILITVRIRLLRGLRYKHSDSGEEVDDSDAGLLHQGDLVAFPTAVGAFDHTSFRLLFFAVMATPHGFSVFLGHRRSPHAEVYCGN